LIVVPKNKAETVLMAQWACDILETKLELFGFDRYGNPIFETMGFSRDGELLCVFVVHQYMPPNIFIAFASKSPRWASKENLRALGIWIFDDLGCDRMTTLTEKKNRRSRKFQEGVGFRYEGNIKGGTYNDDLIIYGLTKEDHEVWLRKAFNGKTRSSTTA
jgi:hypothetical protein